MANKKADSRGGQQEPPHPIYPVIQNRFILLFSAAGRLFVVHAHILRLSIQTSLRYECVRLALCVCTVYVYICKSVNLFIDLHRWCGRQY